MQAKSLRALLLGAAALSLMSIAPSAARAQFQAQVNYNLDLEQFGAGAGYNFNLGSLTEKNGVTGVASFDYYMPRTFGNYGIYGEYKYNYWEVNANGKMDIKSVAGLYVGAGAGLGHFSYSYSGDGTFPLNGSSDFHLNVLSGYNFGDKNKGPFVEAGFNLGGGSSLRMTGGFRF